MIGQPGFMPPTQQGPVNDTGGGNKTQPVRQPFQFPYQDQGNRGFNPTGGLGNPTGGLGQPTDQPFPGQFSFQGGGPGFMPPPPIQQTGNGFNPMQRPPGGPMRVPPPVQTLPGWAGYLQWLQTMGGQASGPPPPIQRPAYNPLLYRFPPPPIQGY